MSDFRDPIDWEETLPIRPSSPAWRAVVRAMYGTLEAPDEIRLFMSLSGGRPPPVGGCDEFLAVAGRRGGKSETIARVATFEAIHGGHSASLAEGQVGLIPVISPLREQSQEIIGYVRGLCSLPKVRRYVHGEPAREGVTFKTGVAIRIMTADAVNVSGPTIVTVIRDEWGKWPDDASAMSDRQIEDSLRPAMAPVRGAARRRFIGITSANIQDGLAFETDRDHYGKPDAPVLVVRGDTPTFNPNIDTEWLAREAQRVGQAVFDREYRSVWMASNVEGFLPEPLVNQYFADLPAGYVFGRDAIIGLDPSKMRKDRDATGFVIAVWCTPDPRPRYEEIVPGVFRLDECGEYIALPRPTKPLLRIVECGEFDHSSGLTLRDAVERIVTRGKRWGASVVASDDYESTTIMEPCTKAGLRRVLPYRWDRRSKTQALGTIKRMVREESLSGVKNEILRGEMLGLRCSITRSGDFDFETHGLDVLSALISVGHFLNDPDGIGASESNARPLDGDPRRAHRGERHVVHGL